MVRTTLVTDGTSDVVLVPILQWLMRQVTPEEFEIRWADPRAFRQRTHNLADKLAAAFREYAYVAEVEHGIRGSGTRNPVKGNARRSAATIGQPVTSIEGGSGDRDVPVVP